MPTVDDYFKSKYLKVDDLEGKPRKLTIKNIGEFETDDKGTKPTLMFEQTEKELGLNKTNCNILAELIGSRDMEDWIGHTIKLYPTKTEYQGKRVPCIRIDDEFHEAPATTGKAKAKAASAAADDDDDQDIPF